ncbi:hypothetical protein BLOT_010819 [Blomia tropicalis]|nr:hypothetical protein BLOT_010819 [Blomia tropicalis]
MYQITIRLLMYFISEIQHFWLVSKDRNEIDDDTKQQQQKYVIIQLCFNINEIMSYQSKLQSVSDTLLVDTTSDM